MSKKSENKDPGVDEVVTMEVIEPSTKQRDDALTDYIDPNQLDAPYVAPWVLSDAPKPADLTGAIQGLWPGNPPNRSGNFYFDLNRLELAIGQTGLLGNLCENFVFERVDVHMIRPAECDFSMDILYEVNESCVNTLDSFKVNKNSRSVVRATREKLYAGQPSCGTYMGKQKVYLRLNDELPKQGRLVINFVGYLIEPWR